MKLAIVGATGVIGTRFISYIRDYYNDVDLVLVGRELTKLQLKFPEETCIDYKALANGFTGCKAVIYLATKNNDQAGNQAAFDQENVARMLEVLQQAKNQGVHTFIHCSSINVIGLYFPKGYYALSKLTAEKQLDKVQGISIVNLRLAAVYSETGSGKLSIFNRLPKNVRTILYHLLSVIKPLTNIDLLLAELVVASKSEVGYFKCISDNMQIGSFYSTVKRISDLIIGFIIFLLTIWIFPIIYFLIKMDSPGSGFFVQKRVGKNKQLFNCYKFRTMTKDTAQAGTHQISSDSVTRIGRFLRATKVDELPQLINIFKNEISLVGPRPCLEQQTELIYQRNLLGIYDVMPGITGLAQIRGIDMSKPRLLAQTDRDYIHRRSLLFDILILIQTVIGKGSGDRIKD